MPNIKDLGFSYSNPGVFENDTSLTSVEFTSALTAIHGYAFRGCSNLSAIYLSTHCDCPAIDNTDMLSGCPTPVSVYVKNQDIAEKFVQDSNWKKLSDNGAIEIVPAMAVPD